MGVMSEPEVQSCMHDTLLRDAEQDKEGGLEIEKPAYSCEKCHAVVFVPLSDFYQQ